MPPLEPPSLNLGVIGNCGYGALVDERARVVWCCLPRFDADPVFSSLLNAGSEDGQWAIEIENFFRAEQRYVANTAVLTTRLYDEAGNAVEVTDFAPRFGNRGRSFRPITLVRRIRPLVGTPRIRIRLTPRFDYGALVPAITQGSNHLRFVGPELTLRLTTNAPVSYVREQAWFLLEEPLSFLLGPDETLSGGVEQTARDFEERTIEYWRLWVRRLAVPLEWQEAVVRAAITLKLCAFEETGAIVAAMTTSIPEAAATQRNWDYRFCWLRDAFFVVRALNSLAEVETMEDYLRYLNNVIAGARHGPIPGHLQPVYGIGLEAALVERRVETLSGYRGMGPVRAGNQAYEHLQHDVYGNVVLAAAQSFFDVRLLSTQDEHDFERLEALGERAFALYDTPDAGMWELRTKAQVHTSSSFMCWACCDRLAKIAARFALEGRQVHWEARAAEMKRKILAGAWNSEHGAFGSSFNGNDADAGVLLMAEVGFLSPSDRRFHGTLAYIEKRLRHGTHLFRYAAEDDFGEPRNAFNICTFWYIDALARAGRRAEAREIFEAMLGYRNHLGLLSEDIDPVSGELWGNYPQTYSLVGIINAATRLSRGWEEAV